MLQTTQEARIAEDALRGVHDRPSLFQFLRQQLRWIVDAEDTFTYDAQSPLGLEGTVRVSQIPRFGESDPFVLMLAEFQTELKRADLRKILQGIRQDDRVTRRYGGRSPEDIIFLCPTRDYQGVSFAHFVQREGRSARLAVFGWDKAHLHETRTLRQINLPALTLPGRNRLDEVNWAEGKTRWLSAWDVQAVTRDFFRDYKQVFDQVQGQITGVPGDARLFTQRLMNRLLFLQFLAKRGWLRFGEASNIKDREDYLPLLWKDWQARDSHQPDANFYRSRLRQLFFLGLNNSACRDLRRDNETLFRQIGEMPFLNGGLFTEEPEDKMTPDMPGADVPNPAIEAVLNLFAQYNFTISESTPDDVEVAVDPEMLGEVFERLVTLDERKSSGSYYTPRVIVQFMCREALKGYLGGHDSVIDRVPGASEEVTKREAEALLRKLTQVRIVDPACGSGAYLLGMLHELFDLMGILETRVRKLSEQDKYQRKLDIIRRNLYGVDLQGFAIETARLRLWLSLVVEDERHPLDNEEDSDVALPNLDFKIERGDSLAAPSPRSLQFALYGAAYAEDARALAQLEAEFFAPNRDGRGRRKDDVRDDIENKKIEIKGLIGSDIEDEDDILDWRVAFAEVFAPQEPAPTATPPQIGGFDIVLANPPYGATVGDDVRDVYFDRRLPAERGQSKDTYGLFIARALQLLRPGGQFSYIVSDTWRTIKSHKPLRRALAQNTAVRHVLDLPAWVFDGPTVNTCILTFTAALPSEGHTLIAGDLRNIKSGDWTTLEENLRSAAAHGVDVQTTRYACYTYKQSLIGTYDNYSFFIGSPKLYGLMSDQRLTRLGDVGRAPHGISTGNNSKYVRTEAGVRGTLPIIEDWMKMPQEEMKGLTETEKTTGVNKDWTELRGCFVPFEKGGESNAEGGWLPNYYVPTQYYINWAKGAIVDMRQNPGSAWKNQQFFFKPGLTFSISGIYAPTFRLNSAGVFEAKGSGIFCDALSPEVLLALLCSNLAKYQFKNFIKHSVDTSGDDIEQFRFPTPDSETSLILEALVKAIIHHQKENPRYSYFLREQEEIDSLIYELYGLDADDIREAELWFCRRYPLLAQAQGVLPEVQTKYADHLAHAARVMARPPSYWQSHPWLALIAQSEGMRLEFKETLAVDPRTGTRNNTESTNTIKAVAAFLNTEGGTLLIGVSDAGEIKGIAHDLALCNHNDTNGFEQKLRQLLDSHLQPPPHSQVVITFETFPEGTICRVEVPAAAGVTYVDKTKVYVRDGNRTPPLDGPNKVEWLERRQGG